MGNRTQHWRIIVDARGFKCGNATDNVYEICHGASITANTLPLGKYAVSKLLVYGERLPEMRIKVGKDLEQTAYLIGHLRGNDILTLRSASRDLISPGKSCQEREM